MIPFIKQIMVDNARFLCLKEGHPSINNQPNIHLILIFTVGIYWVHPLFKGSLDI